uniref:NADH-ubiquinone oxidoreductase 75 kDa subunit n=1 Tax=Paravannella minima TaxID=1443144 RepID=A0A411K7R1_9EUKA|nr:NADH dehydrogenase subunit11 [Paravannella minima]QBC73449.1 NADH dehydrogenase subunit11 [Paravannella minima]
MFSIKINNKSLVLDLKKNNLTIIEACMFAGLEIPRFCYHSNLSIAGNCRMCLVEVKKSVKPVASCAMPLIDNMEIFTNTSLVKKSREGVLEFLLINHPLDCPICDQGGECDLQDQAMIFGTDRGRFYEYKRAVDDKDCSVFIKMIMTRCIHCTRCVRFFNEIGGITNFGVLGRGLKMEIGVYISSFLNSELSGNVIDLCPVGALTSKPYSFMSRSWELNNVDSIDISDSLGSNIRIDFRGFEVMRILPRLNEELNQEWISDIARFNYDSLKRQRLFYPLISFCKGKDKFFLKVSWEKAFEFIKFNLLKLNYFSRNNFYSTNVLIGNQIDCESILVLRDFFSKFGSNFNCSFETLDYNLNYDFRKNYLLNFKLTDLKLADLIFFFGLNPRMENPILNSVIRKISLKKKNLIYSIGFNMNINYNVFQLGNSSILFLKLIEGNHWFNNFFFKSKNPFILFGSTIFKRKDIKFLIDGLNNFLFFKKNKLHFSDLNVNFLGVSPNFIGYNDLSFNLKFNDNLSNFSNVFFNLSSDNIVNVQNKKFDFFIYQGHHIDVCADFCDVILPSSVFIEKNSLFVNNFGMIQKCRRVFYSPGEALVDWKILIALGDSFLNILDYSSLDLIRQRLIDISPTFCFIEILNEFEINNIYAFNNKGFIINNIFISTINNIYKPYYNLLNKFSLNMTLASKYFKKNLSNFKYNI